MEELYADHTPAVTNGHAALPSIQTDYRLPLFGYTVEHINLLLLPYIKIK